MEPTRIIHEKEDQPLVFLAISLVPLPLLGVAAFSKALALYQADAVTRAMILSELLTETVFIVAISVITSVLLGELTVVNEYRKYIPLNLLHLPLG